MQYIWANVFTLSEMNKSLACSSVYVFVLSTSLSHPTAVCCRRRSTETTAWAHKMLRGTRPEPSATSTCGDSCISDRWILSLPCGRCSTCSHRRRKCTATSTTANRPKTSGLGTTLRSWCCSASGCVVSTSDEIWEGFGNEAYSGALIMFSVQCRRWALVWF